MIHRDHKINTIVIHIQQISTTVLENFNYLIIYHMNMLYYFNNLFDDFTLLEHQKYNKFKLWFFIHTYI